MLIDGVGEQKKQTEERLACHPGYRNMEFLRAVQNMVELEDPCQMNDSRDAEGQTQQQRHAVCGAVISDQNIGSDRQAEQRRNNFRARPGQRIQNDIKLPEEMTQEDTTPARHQDCQRVAGDASDNSKPFQYNHMIIRCSNLVV